LLLLLKFRLILVGVDTWFEVGAVPTIHRVHGIRRPQSGLMTCDRWITSG
jgi:hypothetical protein